MNRRTLSDLPSLELVKRLIQSRKAIEQAEKGGGAWRRIFGQNSSTLQSESLQLLSILRQHYEGIIAEIFWRGSGGAPRGSSAATQFCASVFRSFPEQILTLGNYLTFSPALWHLVDRRMNAQFGAGAYADAAVLKPKFMLRQFIDDLPNGEPRGVLRAFAYDRGPDPGDGIAIERRTLLQQAYPWLHAVLWRNRNDLERRTGGTITVTSKRPAHEDLARYEQWLFLS